MKGIRTQVKEAEKSNKKGRRKNYTYRKEGRKREDQRMTGWQKEDLERGKE